jgi:hypothetical protein
LLWSLICWAAYGFADVFEDWIAAHANWIAGDAIIGSLIQGLLNAGQGLGLIVTLIVWAIGAALILIPTIILRKLFRKRQRLAPRSAMAMPIEPERPRHSSAHTTKGNMIGKMLDASRKYR